MYNFLDYISCKEILSNMDIVTVKNKIFNRNFILFVVIFILVIIASVLFFIFRSSSENSTTLQMFSSSDGTISLSVYDSFGFSEYKDDSYVLALNSAKIGASIYVSKFPTSNVRDIFKFVDADKNDYISKFSNINQVSDINEYTVCGLPAYNCHFNYKDSMYVDVYWVLKDSDLYVIDFNLNKEKGDLDSHIGEILDSLKFN